MGQVYTRLKPQFENIHFERKEDTMVLNFGPQHPSTHGQLRLVLELDGERVKKATPEIGYLHRGIEKLAENMIYNEFMPTTDRLDYISAIGNNYAFALGVERLLGIQAPRKAQVIRTTLLELNRIISHIFFIAVHAMDVGALSMFLYAFKTREYGLDLIEDYCGARLTHNAIRIGGVPLDFSAGWLENLEAFLAEAQKGVQLFEGLLDNNRIWKMRLEGVGAITQESAKSWGVSGIMLRATGIAYDIRKEEPYELYSELDFSVPVGNVGDSYDRYRLYMLEILESIKMLKQLIAMYRECEKSGGGDLMARAPEYISAPKEEIMTQNYSLMQHFVLVTQGMRPPKGEVYAPTESPRGELGFFIHSLGEPYPQRVKIKTPSFAHTALLQEMLVGCYIADIVTIVGSCNAIFGEVDR
ncbi:NADH dehydrogenase (quinone) subunit D [Helicobacter sp. CLO-3]|uniref:NADH dehydrogenase (quinone) subunit D n=1 Tax=unclassified Helicobacter TaxID=2593540 RepID=UPI000805E8DE|nr:MULTISPECIES: NADH dehydrogenase (quinone) subunit D [unclassified Helicobacter]OBV29674.1 NADH dehydrogenase (quinone) subunit D [Helicobacter sp. CLO-3]OHU82438.1 NADH dehydrogenase (quinone) subunit D [Helicobacter sp. CLO-3]